MRTLVSSVLLAGVVISSVAGLAGCGNDDGDADDGRLAVVATIAPAAAVASAVGGDLVRVRVLVEAGVDPHDYELKASDRKALDRAKLIVRNGAGIDAFADRVLDGDDRLITLTEGLDLREVVGGAQGGTDPHAWHDIELVARMADSVASALSSADGANAERYRQNAEAYKARLRAADEEIRRLIETVPAANRKMVTNHDAFGYFIERYGLEFVGAVIPSLTTAAEPSAKDTAELVDTIRRLGVKAIFAESSVDPKIAEQIGKETGARVVDDLYGDSLGPAGSGAETIEGMLLVNARKIVEALK